MGNWSKLKADEKVRVIKFAIQNGVSNIKDIRDTFNMYSSDNQVDALYAGAKKVERGETPNYNNTISEQEAERLGYFKDNRGHRDDRVKLPNHPTHPSRGTFVDDRYDLSDKGIKDVNHTLFGLVDNGDGYAIPTYTGSIVLPEMTVTPKGNYVHNTYDNIKLHYKNGGHLGHWKDGTQEGEGQDLNYPNLLPEVEVYPKWYDQEWAKRSAAGLSALGTIATYIPHPYAKAAGLIAQVPDIYYDTRSLVSDVKNTDNWIDEGLNTLILDPFFRKKRPLIERLGKGADYLGPFKKINIPLSALDAVNDGYYAITGNKLSKDVQSLVDNKKSTGGPLYPFSFEKNPSLKTPIVRYDEGGDRDTYNLYNSGDNLVHKKAGEEQGESSYIQKQDNTNIYSLPIIDPVPVPDDMRLSDEKLVALNHAKALYANEGLEIVSPEFDLLTLARGFMTEPLRIIKGKNAAKKPLAIGAEDFTYGTKDNINKYFDNAVKSEATQLLENPRYRGLLELPYEDIAIYRNLPDEVLDIYSEGVIPRMVEQRPWLNADDFIRDIENALLYRSPGYAVYPDKVFVKAGLDDVAGMYFPSTGQISIAEGYVQKALPHEIRHKLDDAIDLTLSENNYLQNAYGNIFSDMKGFKTSDMAKEMVTTNLDSRLKLLGRHSTSDIKIQNALIDRASDDLIFKAVEQSNSYGKKFIELLKEQGLLTPERAQYFRDAMKYVGMFSAPMVLATTTDNQKSTGGPLYPFSFEKKSFLKTPVVRYDEGGFLAKLFGKKDESPTPEEIKADRVERFINDTWETEYSVPKGYDPVTGLYFPYNSPEGGTKTIGPGFKLRTDGSGDATMFTAKEAARGVTREQINEKLRAQGELQYDKVLEFLNQKGNRLPVDTINPNIMNGLMDLRFQVGSLGGWNNLREAVLKGDLEGIKKESKVTFEDKKTGKTKVDTRRNDLRAEKFWHYD